MATEADTGVMHLQAKEHQGWLAMPKSRKSKEGSSSRAAEGAWPSPNPDC